MQGVCRWPGLLKPTESLSQSVWADAATESGQLRIAVPTVGASPGGEPLFADELLLPLQTVMQTEMDGTRVSVLIFDTDGTIDHTLNVHRKSAFVVCDDVEP